MNTHQHSAPLGPGLTPALIDLTSHIHVSHSQLFTALHAYSLPGPTGSDENVQPEPSGHPEGVPTTDAIRPVWPTLKENASEYDHQLHPTPDHKIQCNRVAAKEWEHYHVEWLWTDDIDPESSAGQELDACGRGSATGDGRFLRELKVGDMLTVWGRARFPGWTNYVREVQVRVYWAL